MSITEIIYSVFVSSTFEDLREERGELQKALLKLKCFPIGMELFPSSDDETWDFIKRQIDQADYYIVVIAGRYGSVGSDGVSYTEMEYDYARSIRKPILAFIHGEPGKITAERTEQEPDRRRRLEAFKTKVQRSIVSKFTSPHELATQVVASLVDLRDRKPAVGFIRADQAIDPRKYADILEENIKLKETINKLQPSMTVFSGATEKIAIDIEVVGIDDLSKELPGTRRVMNSTRMAGEIFVFVAETIIDGKNNEVFIEHAIMNSIQPHHPRETRTFLQQDRMKFIKRRLFGARLVGFEPAENGMSIYDRWNLTDYGQTQYGLLSRPRRLRQRLTH
jgi:hypothetical protein